MAMLKHYLNFLRSYCSISSIHGFSHFSQYNRYKIEHFIWICLIITAIYEATVLSQMTFKRYIENPTVISMERDRFSWNTSFPAATICPTFKVNKDALENYVSKTSDQKNSSLFQSFLISLLETTYTNLDEIIPYDGVSEENYIKLVEDLQFKFKPSITNSGIDGKRYFLQKIISEMGVCYSFNSKLAVYNSPEYWNNGRWDLQKGNDTFNLNPLDGEIFVNVVNISTGFDIYIHGPYEVADIASKKISSPNGYFLQIYLSALTLFSSENIRMLSINQRKCRFYDESDLSHSPVYSYVLCRMECRANLAKKLCGCIPHFYRKLDGEKVCNVKGLHCLSKYKEKLILLKGECSCLPNCDEVNYVLEDTDTREWFLGSNLQWGLKEYPKMRLRRDVMFGFSDLLVYIGGMAGLFLGCSVLSFIEIIYFFSIRFYWFTVHKNRESIKKNSNSNLIMKSKHT